MDRGVFLTEKLDAAVHEKCAEYVDNPVEALNQPPSRHDESGAHDQRPQNSPEENFVLVLGWNLKEAENQQKHEQVVDAQRKLDHVSGDELQRGRPPVPEIDHHRE